MNAKTESPLAPPEVTSRDRAAGAATAAVEVEDLRKTFGGRDRRVVAVDGLSLRIPAAHVFGFLGPNGAGKTTTIKMMLGLVRPDGGHTRLNGHDVARDRAGAMRQVGAVLEGSRNVYWGLSAWQNLMYFGRLKGQRGRDIAPRAERLLGDLALWDRRDDPVGTFSRGMQQKVANRLRPRGRPADPHARRAHPRP